MWGPSRPRGATRPSPTTSSACRARRCCPAPSTRTATHSSRCCAASATTSTSWPGATACSTRTRRGWTARASISAPPFAFAEMLGHGATTCVDFFYLQDDGNDNAEAVIRAARDTGIRLVLARTMYDWDGAPAPVSRDAGERGPARPRADRRARRRPDDHRAAGAPQPARRLARDDPRRRRGGERQAGHQAFTSTSPRASTRGSARSPEHGADAGPLPRPPRRARPAHHRRALRVARRRASSR